MKSKLDRWDYVAIPITITAGAFAVICSAFVKSAGGDISGWWLTGQILATITAALVPSYVAVRAKRREAVAKDRELDSRTQARVQIDEALDPIVRCLASGATRSSLLLPGLSKRRRALRVRVLDLVVKTAAEIVGPEHGTRSCYLELRPGRRKSLVPTDHYAGRLGAMQTPFIEGTANGDFTIGMVLSSGPPLFYRDLDTESPPGLDRASIEGLDYKTFISVPVVGGDTAYGMLTVDSRHPNDLHEHDRDLLVVMAGLAAIALGIG